MSTDKDMIRARFAANLKALRLHMGWSQETMANAMGVKRSSLAGYEQRQAEPDLRFLQALQQRFGVGVDVLLSSELGALRESQWMQVKMMPPRVLDPNPART